MKFSMHELRRTAIPVTIVIGGGILSSVLSISAGIILFGTCIAVAAFAYTCMHINDEAVPLESKIERRRPLVITPHGSNGH
jgi:hypothetical protein